MDDTASSQDLLDDFKKKHSSAVAEEFFRGTMTENNLVQEKVGHIFRCGGRQSSGFNITR